MYMRGRGLYSTSCPLLIYAKSQICQEVTKFINSGVSRAIPYIKTTLSFRKTVDFYTYAEVLRGGALRPSLGELPILRSSTRPGSFLTPILEMGIFRAEA